MPRLDSAPTFGLISSFDPTPWAGEIIFRRGATNVTGSAAWTVPVEDALTLLTGRGSEVGNTFGEQLAAEMKLLSCARPRLAHVEGLVAQPVVDQPGVASHASLRETLLSLEHNDPAGIAEIVGR